MSRADDAISGGLPRERERPGCPGPVRGPLFAHAAFAALTAVYFLSDPHRGTARSAAAVTFLVAGATSLVLGLPLPRRRYDLRRSIIALETLLVPLQFALSVLSDLALIGMVLSIVIL